MTTTLISFLGRPPKRDAGYRTTDYRFSDGSIDRAAFFGFSLQRRIQPQRLVVLGTDGSMWDHLFERDVLLGGAMEGERLALMDAVANKKVEQVQLERLTPALANALGCAVELRLIPYAREEREQFAIVQSLVAAATGATRLHLDITHSFRHLPLLALTALHYLRAVEPAVVIDAVWYGAYDEDSHDAPVHDLSGLLKILDGAEAVTRFDANGDYGALADLMPVGARELLHQAAFFERSQQIGQARGRVRAARQVVDTDQQDGLPALFQTALRQRLTWVDEDRLYQRQRALALQHLGRGDELRAALYGFEAFITRTMQTDPTPGNDDPNNFEHRQDAKARYEDQARRDRDPRRDAYKLLRDIRNQLAHGVSSPRAEVQRSMADAATLKAQLGSLLTTLLPDD